MNAREKQCTPFTGLFPWRPCFPLCFGTGQIGESDQSAVAVHCKSRVVHHLQKSRMKSGQHFPFFRWQCVLRMSLEIALSEQGTSQICQSTLCKRWSRWRQESFRGCRLFARRKLPPCSGPNLIASIDTRLEEQKTSLAAQALCLQCHQPVATLSWSRDTRSRDPCSLPAQRCALACPDHSCA